MIFTVFENEYVEVVTRKQADYMIKNFIKTCDCNWSDYEEDCNRCCSIRDLEFKLKDNPSCVIFVRLKYKYKYKYGWRWHIRNYVSSISEYIDEELEDDIKLVKTDDWSPYV